MIISLVIIPLLEILKQHGNEHLERAGRDTERV